MTLAWPSDACVDRTGMQSGQRAPQIMVSRGSRTPARDVSLISGRPVDHEPTAVPTTRR